MGPEDGWKIWKGSLYVNDNADILRRWLEGGEEDVDRRIEAAELRWKSWWGSDYEGAYNNACYDWNWEKCKDAGHGWSDVGIFVKPKTSLFS